MERNLGLGKLNKKYLEKLVLKHLPVLGAGLDSSPLPYVEDAIISVNPAIGVPTEALGFFAFHYAASNIAVSMAKPLYATFTVLLPPGFKGEDLEVITREFGCEARRYGVSVVAGHTATYKGVEQPLVVTTMIGRRIRAPRKPSAGDKVLVVGEVAAESLWLLSLAGKAEVKEEFWRQLTPLPAALRLTHVEGVKLMHDVSEGGLLGALIEVSEHCHIRIDIKREELPLHPGVAKLVSEVLSAPSYGCLLAIVNGETVDEVLQLCREEGFSCAAVGEISAGDGVYVDNVRREAAERGWIDELYGEFSSADPVLASLKAALRKLEKIGEAVKLIPEVGMNMVYARRSAEHVEDVAGLSGRVVKSLGKPRVCGEVVYGGSRHLALVALEAARRSEFRAAVNIRAGSSVLAALKKLGLEVEKVPMEEGGTCPVASYIARTGRICRAYFHPGALGVEPSVVLLGRDPWELVELLKEVAKLA